MSKEPAMTIQKTATEFTDLLKQNDHEGAATAFNADNIVSYEAEEGPMSVCKGKEAVRQKGEWWTANHEVHGGSIEGPFVHGDQFSIYLTMDITPKATGERMTMREVCLYTVKDGKVVEERFFY